MAPSFDHALGQRLAQLIQQSGEEAFEAGVLSRRLQAQLQDLLGAETALLNPLRDLLQRPAFRQLFQLNSQGQILNGRDALLGDLSEVYSPAIVARLDAVLQGCLNLSGAATPWPTAQPASAPPPAAPSQIAPSQIAPSAAPATTVVAIPARSQAPTAILIALLALLCGALVMALAGMLVSSRGSNGTTSTTPAPSPANPPAPTAPPSQPQAPKQPAAPAAPSSTAAWQACIDYASDGAAPQPSETYGAAPQPGETWWPVVGPAEALAASRQHCRGDAFTKASGNVQVASFRDRGTAAAFAEQLTRDNSHPYSFWVGDPSVH